MQVGEPDDTGVIEIQDMRLSVSEILPGAIILGVNAAPPERTLEMLDQIELLDEMNQIGFVARNSVTYKDGKQVTSRGWHVMFERMHGTFLDYCLNIRQKFSETVYRNAYSRIGGKPFIGWKLENFTIDNSTEGDFKVTSHLTRVNSDDAVTVKR